MSASNGYVQHAITPLSIDFPGGGDYEVFDGSANLAGGAFLTPIAAPYRIVRSGNLICLSMKHVTGTATATATINWTVPIPARFLTLIAGGQKQVIQVKTNTGVFAPGCWSIDNVTGAAKVSADVNVAATFTNTQVIGYDTQTAVWTIDPWGAAVE